MPDKNPAEKSDEVILKKQIFIPHRTLNQNKQPCQGFDGNLSTTYFFNVVDKFTAKQGNVMGNFAEVLAENQSKKFISI